MAASGFKPVKREKTRGEQIHSSVFSQRKYARGYNFKVYFEDVIMSFSHVSGIEKTIATEGYSEGGMNHHTYIVGKPNQTMNTMTFERGYLISDKDEGTRIEPGYQPQKDIAIFVLDGSGKALKTYYLSGAIVTKVTIGDFDASSSNLLIERIEVAYEKCEYTRSLK